MVRRVVPKGFRLLTWYGTHLGVLRIECCAHLHKICHGVKWSMLRCWLRWERASGLYPILVHIHNAGQVPYIQPILQALRKSRAPVCLYAAVDDRSSFEMIATLKIPRLRCGILKDWNRAGDLFDSFISPTFWLNHAINVPTRICVFHGLPSKGNTFPPSLVQLFTTLFLLGPTQRNLFQEFATTHPEIAARLQVYKVGYPKTDNLLQGTYNRESILLSLGLDPREPVVLYAPAFDLGTSLHIYGRALFDVLARMKIQVLIKLHPASYDPRYVAAYACHGVPWSDILSEYEKNSKLRHVGNQPLDPYLAASDVMVTDISGAALEFLLLDRPVVYLHCPDFFEKAISQDKVQYPRSKDEVMNDTRADAGRSAGLVAWNLEELPAAIRRSIRHPEEFSVKRNALRGQLLYNPGHAAEAAVATLMGVVGQTRKTRSLCRWEKQITQCADSGIGARSQLSP